MTRDRIVIKRGDITAETTDAVVNAANTELMLGSGVAGAIRGRGGPTIQKECNAHGPVPLGEAAVTGAGDLPARYVIHAAGMALGGPMTTERSLRDCVLNSMKRAGENECRSVAFPAIGTGVAGFPVERCAQIMLETISAFLRENPSPVEEVHLVLFDEPTCETFRKMWEKMSQGRSTTERREP